MHELLNVLYVQTQGAVLHLEHDTVRVSLERETMLRAPLLQLGGIVVFGQVTLTPFLIQRCAEDGRSLVWLTRTGRFRARVEGPARGNVSCAGLSTWLFRTGKGRPTSPGRS